MKELPKVIAIALLFALALASCKVEYSGDTPEASECTVTFCANDGSPTPATATQTFITGVPQSLTPISTLGFTRSGCIFASWGTTPEDSDVIYKDRASFTAHQDTTLYAQWAPLPITVSDTDGNTLEVTGLFNGGGYSFEMTDTSATVESQSGTAVFVHPKRGYKFRAFSVTDSNGILVKFYTLPGADWYAFTMPTSSVTITAAFTIVDYTITVADIAHGTVTASKTVANIGEEITLSATLDEGYIQPSYTVTTTDGEKVTVTDGKFAMPAGNVVVSTSITAIDYTITIVDNDDVSVTASKAIAHAGDEITLSLSFADGTAIKFAVTTSDGNAVELLELMKGSLYSFSMPADSVSVTADLFQGLYKFHESVTSLPSGTDGTRGTSGAYVLFGDWPQTIKAENVTVNESTFIVMGAHIYYDGSDGNWYAKVLENGYSTDYKYSDGTSVAKENTDSPRYLYFKVEPVKWRVLTDDYNGKKLLLAEDILTADVPYYDYSDVNRIVSSATVYPNNYEHSAIRAYLNGLSYQVKPFSATQTNSTTYLDKGFLQTAFTASAQALIASTTVDNSVASTNPASNANLWNGGKNGYACPDTTDKIFLLSEKEVTTISYSFGAYNNNSSGAGNTRIKQTTDYAKANYAYQHTTAGMGGWWWLRSPYYSISRHACVVTYNGSANSYNIVRDGYGGVSPALSLSF